MAGIAIALDIWRKSRSFSIPHSAQTLQSYGLFSATTAASAAAASIAVGYPFGFKNLFSIPVAHCDAGAEFSEVDVSSILQSAHGKLFATDVVIRYDAKECNIQLKPLFSAFEWKALAMTTVRSFLMFYLPLLEPRTIMEDEEEFSDDNYADKHVDLVVPLKKSLKQIVRETTVVTTRRILERMVLHYVSQRMARKLLKDVPKSATRKALREMPTTVYFFCVSRTTFRGHFLGVAASWLVQVGIEIYRFFRSIACPKKDEENVNTAEEVTLLRKRVSIATVRCSSSLVFASIGAGIGATLFRPSTGQWIGCAVGDLAGPSIVAFCAQKVLHTDL